MEILQLPWSRRCQLLNTPQLNYGARCFQDNPSGRTTQKTSPFVVVEVCLPRRCIATIAARTTQKPPSFYCCGLYLATAAVYSHYLATGLYATIYNFRKLIFLPSSGGIVAYLLMLSVSTLFRFKWQDEWRKINFKGFEKEVVVT
jgi:hypothetical protein